MSETFKVLMSFIVRVGHMGARMTGVGHDDGVIVNESKPAGDL